MAHSRLYLYLSSPLPATCKILFNVLLLDFDIIDQLLITHILEDKLEHNGAVHPLFVQFKKAYYSLKKDILNLVYLWN